MTALFDGITLRYEARIRAGRDLLIKKGITVLNSSETIDADYNGEIWFKLISLSIENFIMEEGERICRIIIGRHENASWERVGILLETYRGN